MSRTEEQRAILNAASLIKRQEGRERRRATKEARKAGGKATRGQEVDKGFRQYVRRQPCEAARLGDCSGPVQHAHVSYRVHGIANSFGRGVKNHDRHGNPLCAKHHKVQHDMGDEQKFWAMLGKDAYATAAAHYEAYLTPSSSSNRGDRT